jgi:sec-independent protein translocase protein TatA
MGIGLEALRFPQIAADRWLHPLQRGGGLYSTRIMYFTDLAIFQSIGATELLIIFVIILLLFGSKKLPELARGLGRSMKEFKKATQDVQQDFQEAMDAADPQKPMAGGDPSKPTVKPSAGTHTPD